MNENEARKQAIEKFGIPAIVKMAWDNRNYDWDSVVLWNPETQEIESALLGNGTIQNPEDESIGIYRIESSEVSDLEDSIETEDCEGVLYFLETNF